MLILRLLMFLLPFGLFSLWLHWRRTKGADERRDRQLVLIMLAMVGFNLLVAGLYVGLHDAPGRDATYLPPHMEDGRIVPGTFKEPE